MNTIYFVDNHVLMLSEMSSFPKPSGNYNVIGTASNGYEILWFLNKNRVVPNFAIIDANMPVLDGVLLTKILHDHYPEIITIGVSNNSYLLLDMIDAGAKAFISKRNFDSYIIEAIDKTKRGHLFIEPEFKDQLDFYIKKNETKDKKDDISCLTKKQVLYLQLSASGLDNFQIAKLLNVSEKSLHNYQESIKDVLGISTKNSQIMYALKNGIVKIFRL